eukprot:gene10797-14470_t
MLISRPRRNRKSAAIRDLVQETTLSVNDFIFPMFVMEGSGIKSEIKSMPNIYRFSIDTLLEEIKEVSDLGIKSICLFPNYPEAKKDKYATESHNSETLYLKALSEIKDKFPHIALMTDVAMDPYSSVAHGGVADNGEIWTDATPDIF